VRLASFSLDSAVAWGIHIGDGVVPASALGVEERWPTLLDLVRAGDDALVELSKQAMRGRRDPERSRVRLLAPIPVPPQNPIAVGLNYRSHAQETIEVTAMGEDLASPMIFTKARSSVIGPEHPILIDPRVAAEVDWEVELTVIVGRAGRNIQESEALDHVFGYTVGNDISARDLQFRDTRWPQFHQGKSLDTFCPIGPWIVTRDEIDVSGLRLSLRVNGVTKQNASTREMIFDVSAIIAEVSRARTIEAGELILTGTPEGVGFTRQPPEFLKPGDVVEAEVEGIGILRNPVELEPSARGLHDRRRWAGALRDPFSTG
jgi:2-keto-4-pentenoate hydratase/2-oxohepta-3-ene-1,7-dioic acid hydratase in catechol pathway